jgi:DNA repair exonuclease SbcCD ATPase subunit
LAATDDAAANLERFVSAVLLATTEVHAIAARLEDTDGDRDGDRALAAEEAEDLRTEIDAFGEGAAAAFEDATSETSERDAAAREMRTDLEGAYGSIGTAWSAARARADAAGRDATAAHAQAMDEGFAALDAALRDAETALGNEWEQADAELEALLAGIATTEDASARALAEASVEEAAASTTFSTAISDVEGVMEEAFAELARATDDLRADAEGTVETIGQSLAGLVQQAERIGGALGQLLDDQVSECAFRMEDDVDRHLDERTVDRFGAGAFQLQEAIEELAKQLEAFAALADALPALGADLRVCRGIIEQIDLLLEAL